MPRWPGSFTRCCCISRAPGGGTGPDWKFIKTFYHYLVTHSRDNKDDTLLGALADAFAAEGIEFHPATDFAPELLVKQGQIAGRPPTAAQQKDIEFGWEIAKQMGGLDIGQSVCIKDRAVIAVEAIEGTDACILRAGELCKKGGFTVVKVAKPQQDMRFDVPTVGVRTLRTMLAAGARVLAIEGGRTILLDDDEFRQFAAYHRLSVVALPDTRRVRSRGLTNSSSSARANNGGRVAYNDGSNSPSAAGTGRSSRSCQAVAAAILRHNEMTDSRVKDSVRPPGNAAQRQVRTCHQFDPSLRSRSQSMPRLQVERDRC